MIRSGKYKLSRVDVCTCTYPPPRRVGEERFSRSSAPFLRGLYGTDGAVSAALSSCRPRGRAPNPSAPGAGTGSFAFAASVCASVLFPLPNPSIPSPVYRRKAAKNRTASLCFYRDGRKILPLRRRSFGALFAHHKIEDGEGARGPVCRFRGAARPPRRPGPDPPPATTDAGRAEPRAVPAAERQAGLRGGLRAAGCGKLVRHPQLFTDGRELRAGAGSQQRWGESGGPVGKGAAGGGVERAGGGRGGGERERESGGRRPPAKGGSRGAGLTPPC